MYARKQRLQLCVLCWANPSLGPLKGVGPENLDFFGPKLYSLHTLPFQDHKSLDFQGPTLPMALVMDLSASNHYVLRHINKKWTLIACMTLWIYWQIWTWGGALGWDCYRVCAIVDSFMTCPIPYTILFLAGVLVSTEPVQIFSQRASFLNFFPIHVQNHVPRNSKRTAPIRSYLT